MNRELLQYVKELSRGDRKSFSQKVIKLFEEGGELAKKALPFDDAHGTRHRFTSKDSILEEVADVILVALSIGYDLGMDDDDLEATLNRKARYWNELQATEAVTAATSFPYEIHITVTSDSNWDYFAHICSDLAWETKPLLLANYSIENKTIENAMMLSHVVKGTPRQANERLSQMVEIFQDAGFNVIRQKIETVPWHPASNRMPINPNGVFYLENHMKVRVDKSNFEILNWAINQIRSNWKNDTFGLSWNTMKPAVDGVRTYFFTYRSKLVDKESFKRQAAEVADMLRCTPGIIEVTSENLEFSVYDTAESQDDSWMRTLAA
jgi:NTP pyrophosphatase (non-canonical NTP hydrolase)